MRKLVFAGFILLSMTVVAFVGSEWGNASMVKQPLTGRIELEGRSTFFKARDVGLDGHTLGDLEAEYISLRNPDNPVPIGNALMYCRWLGPVVRFCDIVVSLPRGRITASGTRFAGRRWFLAVTGGTGAYKGVGGTAKFFQTLGDKKIVIVLV